MEMKLKENLENKVQTYIDYVKQVNNGHVGGSLSVVHTFMYLNDCVCKNTKEQIIFSKGHASLGVYVMDAVNKKVKISDVVKNFEADNSPFTMIAKRNYSNEYICFGNLGNGISYSVGKAIANKNKRLFCVVGDGELDEGLCWESFMAAAKYKLSNLFVIIDNNKFSHDGKTDDIMPLGSIYDKMKAFNFNVIECDGHDFEKIEDSFNQLFTMDNDKPNCLIIDTIKAFGIKEIENTIDSHSL